MTPLLRNVLPWLLPLAFVSTASAQQPVSVGQGSYASEPPAGLMMDRKKGVDAVAATESRRVYLVKDDGQPIPSNKWFQNLVFQQYGAGLWAMPHKVDATKEGVEIFHPNSFSGDGARALAEFPLIVTGRDFHPQDSRAKSWSDWTVAFRMFESDTRFMDVTLGEGMPAVWCEFTGVPPLLALGGQAGKGSRGRTPAQFFDLSGAATALPVSGDALGLTYENRSYGIFAPAGTKFEQTADGIAVTFAGPGAFLVICPLPAAGDLAFFHRHARAVPRDTQLTWKYDRQAGVLTTTWKIIAEPLQAGAPREVIQGFLPHHWRENQAPLKLDGPAYSTIRGALKCGVGDTFTLAYPFNGILPNLPAPTATSFDAGRVKELLATHFAEAKRPLGADTYGGGKDLQRYAEAAFMAEQLKDPSKDAIVGKLRSALENWFTYTPGEKERFFAYYPRRKGLVGFNAAFGSEHFTDHHFHFGYFVHAAGLLCQLDPDFAQGYGDFARLVAKNYANYDRQDARFPRFRTFDLWRGHSFADGNGFPDGNNQESTGEAVNSWAGMILLGEALGDPELAAAGVMGYSFETRANLEYWFDPHHDVFPQGYAHRACGMVWCGSIVWGTWFTASPAWIYGIQWLPSGPQAAFYDRDPAFIARTYGDLEKELGAFEEKEAARKPGHVKMPVAIKTLGGELGSYHLGFLMHADPRRVVTELDTLWSEPGDQVAHHEWMANIYYQAHALLELGRVDWSAHGDTPTSMVYRHERTGRRTLVAWNPTAQPRTVAFREGAKPIGRLEVAPRSLARAPAAK
ncbi:MAG TPA: glycosyl hydrolase [Chthoniobacteraceae bacterium]|jgi:endoglucanase Acf2|nr:glycosyl hydrolase [Chthoniobacteraceae bacterium]